MGWSVNYLRSWNPNGLDSLLAPVGRALHIATEFEHKCRWVLGTTKLGDHYAESGDDSAAIALALAAQKRLLHPIVSDLAQDPKVDPEDSVLLVRAKEARNFIAHKSAGAFEHSLEQQLDMLRREVRALAAGDNVVSRWVHEIEEKEPEPRHIQEHYVEWVEQWVFGT